MDSADQQAGELAYQIMAAADAVAVPDFPPPCRHNFLAGLRHPWPGDAPEHALVYSDGVAVGYLVIGLPQLDNTDNATLDVYVHPDHRRRGVGRASYEYAVGRARQLGRKRVMGSAVATLPGGPDRDPAGGEFAAAMGARAVLAEVRRRLDVSTVDQAALDRLLAQAWRQADGYELVQWVDPAPEEYVADLAYLDGRLVADAPMGDLAWEPEKVDVARVRGAERAIAERQLRHYHSGIRHEGSGQLVAWTTLSLTRTVDWHASQQITIVEPRHRGHRLGTIVKIENLRWTLAAEPALRVVDTFNAAANDHMIAINEAIGFRPVDAWHNWQQEL
jgi:GNAT superfamily N-acetyltransferase